MSASALPVTPSKKHSQIDVASSINEYLERRDWRVNANANQGYSLGGLILNVSGKVIANYWLDHVYPPAVGDAHRCADFHIHESSPNAKGTGKSPAREHVLQFPGEAYVAAQGGDGAAAQAEPQNARG